MCGIEPHPPPLSLEQVLDDNPSGSKHDAVKRYMPICCGRAGHGNLHSTKKIEGSRGTGEGRGARDGRHGGGLEAGWRRRRGGGGTGVAAAVGEVQRIR